MNKTEAPSGISDFSAETSKGKLLFRLMELDNGLMVLISDSNKYRIGPSAVAIPSSTGQSGPSSTGLFTMGVDTTLVRTIAERLSAWTAQPCMAIVAVSDFDRSTMLEVVSILKDRFVT